MKKNQLLLGLALVATLAGCNGGAIIPTPQILE